jgi:hypothetical protein
MEVTLSRAKPARVRMEHPMTDQSIERRGLEDFVGGSGVWEKWDAARRLMAAKQMQSAATSPAFRQSFQELGKIAITGQGIDQLLAIALILRISDLVKGELRKQAADFLADSLSKPIDGLWTISDTKKLPLESKPSEIRENIALALSHASGPWLTSLLSGASTPILANAIAPLLLDTLDANLAVAQYSDSPLAGHLRRICGRIQALASELKLRPAGTIGEIVEFNPTAYRTVSGAIPSEPSVRLRRPMVVRWRDDGSQDIVERGLVEDR